MTAKYSNYLDLNYLCHSIAIVESKSDRWNWGNAEEDEPAFLVYIGFDRREDAIAVAETIRRFYRCDAEVRKAKRIAGFEWEVKVRKMQRYTDSYAWGLDQLLESAKTWEFSLPAKKPEEELTHLAYFDSTWAF
jgi:hypothetical protein